MNRLILGLLSLALVVLVSATGSAERPTPKDRYRISVLTFGPGDHAFLKFGHNAVLVEDGVTGRGDVYNFGTFEFGSPTLIQDFLQGRLLYWLSVQSLKGTLRAYQSTNRSIYIQELRLSTALGEELVAALEQNALPENRAYKYDYYLDNCSTRVRDVLDKLLNGRVRLASRERASLTWRGHTLRLTAGDVPVYLGLGVAMGAYIDAPITRWEEMFIPEKLQETLRLVTVETEAGDLPLVKREWVHFEASRPPALLTPPRWAPFTGLVGVGLGGLLFACAELTSKRRFLAHAYFGLLALLGLVLGLLGTIFAFFWFFTDHQVAYRNENLFQCPPWALILVVTAPLAAWKRTRATPSPGPGRAERLTRRLVFVCCVGSVLGLLVKALPWFRQENSEFIALLLPLWIGGALGAWRLSARSPTAYRDKAKPGSPFRRLRRK